MADASDRLVSGDLAPRAAAVPGLDAPTIAAAVGGAPDAILLFDGDGRIVYANASVTPVLGWAPEELLGTIVGRLLHPDDRASAAASMRSFDGEGAKVRIPSTLRFRRADDSYGTIELNGNPFTAPDGTRLNLMIGRRAEFTRLLTAALDVLSGPPVDEHDGLASSPDAGGARTSYSLEAMVRLLPELVRWRVIDIERTAVVWCDAEGTRHVCGDDLPPELSGLVLGDDLDGPHHRAWRGEELTGSRADLPADLAPLAEALELDAWWLRPVAGADGVPRVVVSLWARQRTHNEPGFDTRLRTLTNLVEVSLRATQQHEQLVHDARHDGLTGLVNRRTFHDALARDRTGSLLTVVMVDLDGFKPVNDRFGHDAGDRVLTEVAARLLGACRVDDVVARIGGDEFAVLCRGCPAGEARHVAERVLAALDAPIELGAASASVSASLGLATGDPADGIELARLADEALYRAKAAGGRRIEVAASP